MEVHAHTHTPRKKWTHYFWEFLMLFLAVFCGFLAENQREHYVEAHRAREYAKSLLNDMKEDTAEIGGGIRQNSFLVKVLDSCIAIGLNNANTSVPGMFYYYSRLATTAYSIDWNKSTITQLVQSGNLRYFKNKELVNKINKYHASQGRIGSNNEQDFDHRNRIAASRSRLLVPKYYQLFSPLEISIEMKGHLPDGNTDLLLGQRLPLQNGSAAVLEEYLNNLMDRKSRNKRYVVELYPGALKQAAEIIEILKKEYHLE
jgi:hypothetical protein